MPDLEKLLKSLSLKEKCALCSGIDFWHTTPIKDKGVESVVVSDGPHGLRKEKKTDAAVANVMQVSEEATCFPPAVTLASTWNRNSVKRVAEALAEEAIDQGVDVVLGPGINIKRNPLCGRNFEYLSEDPYLAGQLGEAYVKGMQGKNVGTSLKHYAVNSQEKRRMAVSSELDERTFREIYLPAFENTVKKAQPYTVMCSYNPINGVYASENKYLLTDILRNEWGFEGIVVSDWGAVNDRVQGIVAGMDLQMPADEGICDRDIEEAVTSGALPEEKLDEVVLRLLKFIDRCVADRVITGKKKCDYDAHFELAAEIAADGAVLLKNNDGILPLRNEQKIAVIGSLAKVMRYQGTGSSQINSYKLCAFTDYLDQIGKTYAYADGYEVKDIPNRAKIEEAAKVAKDADVVIAFVGLTDEYESEGFDREHLDMPASHNMLLAEIAKVNKNIVVVLAGGSPVRMPWLNDAKAVLDIYLTGSAGGKATYKLLFGETNPSGKLAETYPIDLESNPAYKYYQMGPQTVEYRESIYVGYRYFDKANKEVLFPFGHGLSYTSFEYSGLKLSSDNINQNDNLTVAFTVKNVGPCDGAEVAQVYVRDIESSIFREAKALKGFEKVFLKAGESTEISIELDKRSFAYYDVKRSDWTVESGEFEILVGASSRDIRLSAKVFVQGEDKVEFDKEGLSVYYAPDKAEDYSVEAFEKLLGRPLVENRPLKKGEIGYNATIGDIDVCWIGKLIKWAGYNFATIVLPKDTSESMKKMVKLAAMDMPLRNCYAMTNGLVPKKVIDGLIARCNEGPFTGWGRIIGGFFNKPQKKSEIYKL